MSDLATTGFQTEHLFEIQLPKKLLETAITGYLPNVAHSRQSVTPVLKAARLAEASLYAGWNKLYPSSANLNKFYDVVKVPSSYVAPLNTPADRLMTAIGDWGNMQNLLLVAGDVNWVKGKLFSLHSPMSSQTLTAAIHRALDGDEMAAKMIEVVLQNVSGIPRQEGLCRAGGRVLTLFAKLQVFSVFRYMNDAATEFAWRNAYYHINREIENMDQHMPELYGIKAIWDEFLPAYQDAISDKAISFIRGTYFTIISYVSNEMAKSSGHLGKMRWTAEHYAERTGELRWQRGLTG